MKYRILFIGNAGNLGLRICVWLRKKGFDAQLRYPKVGGYQRDLPEWENPSFSGSYPEWIKFTRKPKFPLYRPCKSLRNESKDFDLIFTAGHFIISSLSLGKPVFFIPVGGDITELPFLYDNPRVSWRSILYRKRIRTVSKILTAQEDCIWASKFLGVSHKIHPFPIPVDCDSIRLNLSDRLTSKIKRDYSDLDYIFFNPSRKNISPRSFAYKGNEKFLAAFKNFLKEKPNIKIKAVLGMHGHHVEKVKRLVSDLGLEPNVVFVDHLTNYELHSYLCLENLIVFDQFGTKASINLGGISRESLAMGSPLVVSTNTSSKEFEKFYGKNCPLFFAQSEAEIYNSMIKLVSMPKDQLVKLKKKSFAWAKANIHWESHIDGMIKCMDAVMSKK